MGHGLILCEYELSTFRIERVIKNQASFFMTPKFRIFGRKNRFFAELQKSKILLGRIVSEHLGKEKILTLVFIIHNKDALASHLRICLC